MKKLYQLCLLNLALLGSYYAVAQKTNPAFNLGGTKNFHNHVKQQMQSAALTQQTDKPQFKLQVSATGELNTKVHFQKTDINGDQSIMGEVTGANPGSFFLHMKDDKLEGNIILQKSKKAYKYSSDANGNAFVQEVNIDGVVCVDMEAAPVAAQTTTTTAQIGTAVANLQSLPGAAGCVLLDLDGYNMPAGNLWNNGNAINADPSGMADADIQELWEIVSEDYRPFNLNITTSEAVFNTYPQNRRRRCVITPTNTAAPGAGGVAYVGSFSWTNDVPCWVFITSGKAGGEACSHEVGHTLGLSHDGRELPTTGHEEYYAGQGDWAPIMGVGYYKNITQWSKGEYMYANNQQDDLAIMSSATYGVGYRVDDFGNNTATAANLISDASGNVSASTNKGLIESTTDLDFFSFTTGGGAVTLNVNTVARDGDLDILVLLYNSSGAQIGSFNPAGLNSVVTATLAAGKYFISIDGTGAGDPLVDGYSDYASLGSYFISGTIPPVTAVATFYKDCNYGGYAVGLPVGSYNLSDLNVRGILNDDISSLQINSGYEVQLFWDANFAGSSTVISGNNTCLVSNGWNDDASSLIVRAATPAFTTTIQAENYSAMAGVQTEATTDAGGGLDVGWIDQGDWMAYNSITFPTTGAYLVEYRVASISGAQLSLDLNAGTIQLGALNIPATGGWQNWTTISHTVNINAGTYNLGVFAQTGGWNINWIRITRVAGSSASTARVGDMSTDVSANADVNTGTSGAAKLDLYPNPVESELIISTNYNVAGAHLKIFDATGILVHEEANFNSSINVSNLSQGIYILMLITDDNNKVVQRFTKL